MIKRNFVTFIILLITQLSLAQEPGKVLQQLTDSFPQERIHIHYDKQAYVAGETIWFKGYLFSGFVPSDLSTNFYFQLTDQSGKTVGKKLFPIFSGTVQGSFVLPDTLTTGNYTITAFTPWMLNFDKDFLYSKTVYVYGRKQQKPQQGKANEQYSVYFFPEGGDLVKGVVNVVAFKGVDRFGKPASIQGRIVDKDGSEVASLQTVHDGMGSFGFVPSGDNVYTAEISFEENEVQKVSLPVAKESGWVMQVREESASKRRVILLRPAGGAPVTLQLVGQMQQQMVLQQPINVNGNNALLSFDTKDFPSGILQLTLMDEKNMPVAERLLFINNQEFTLNTEIKTETKSLQPKGKNQFSFYIPDSLYGSFSVSVVDDDRVFHDSNTNDIVSRFLLTSDLKGYVHNPAFYLRNNEKPTRVAVDLLMMTNGWRRFNWKETLAGTFPSIRFRDKNHLQIGGTILSQKTKKPVTKGEVNFILRTKDSLTDFLQVAVADDGRFELDNLAYEDSAEFSFQLNSKKTKERELIVQLDKDTVDYFAYARYLPPSLLNLSLPNMATDLAEVIFTYTTDSSGRFRELATVTVVAKKRKPVEELNARYTSGIFSSMTMAKVYDLVNNDPGAGSQHVLQFIQGRVPGIRVITQGFPPSYSVVSSRGAASITGGSMPVPLFLDEMGVTPQQLETVPMHQVAMIKFFPTGFMGNPGIGTTQALVVYTKKGADALPSGRDYLNAFRYPGYSVAREFFSPNYDISPDRKPLADRRTTILWQPELKQDAETGQYQIQFFNSDNAKRLKLVLEGMLSDGRLVHRELTISE